MPLRGRITDFFLQCFWLGSLFWVLTGGAFLIERETWEFFSANRGIFRALLHGSLGAAVLSAILRWQHHRESFCRLEPMRTLLQILNAGPARVLSGFFLAYTATQFLSLFFMHEGMGTALWDFGFNDQILWNTAHGQFLINSVRGGQNILGEHFFLFLALLSPVYWFQDQVWPLFLLQSAAVAACIPLTYAIARTAGLERRLAVALAVGVFFYTPLRSGILFPFHSETFADPFLLLGFLAAMRRKTLLAILGWGMALTCKENIPVELFGIGAFLISRREKRGWIAIFMACACFLLVSKVIEPHFRFDYQWNKWGFYSHILHPSPEGLKILVRSLLEPNPLPFLALIFGPFSFLSLTAPGAAWLLGPTLAARLITPFPGFRYATAHYTVGLNALIFISAALNLQALSVRRRFTAIPVCTALMTVALFFSGIPQLFEFENYVWEASAPSNQRITRILRSVPEDLSVVATETFLAQLTHRHHLFGFDSAKPGSPLWPRTQNPDLIVSDQKRIQAGEIQKLKDWEMRGYQPAFTADHLTIHLRPELEPARAAGMLEEWRRLAAQPEIPWRKRIRKSFKLLSLLSAAVLLVLLIRKTVSS